MKSALAGQGALADPATGLVHFGNGRFYDPALGWPLQPNPIGGPPTVPQALNRYATTSLGPPGVGEATINTPNFTNISLATGFAKSTAFETLARITWGPFGYAQTRILREAYTEISVTASHVAISRAAGKIRTLGGDLLDSSVGLGQPGSGKYTRVFKLGRGLTTADDLILEANLPTKGGWKANVLLRNVDELAETSRFARFGWLRNTRLGFATDTLLSAGFQWYEDSYNPHFTVWQRGGRSGIAGIGGLTSSVIGFGAGSLVCGPAAGACFTGAIVAVGTAVIINTFWSYTIQPLIFANVEFLQPPPTNLKPLVVN